MPPNFLNYTLLMELPEALANVESYFKRNISKNTKMEYTPYSYIKFNVESVPSVHSSQNSFLTPPK